MSPSARELRVEDVADNRPVHAVWELTLACNLKCVHCGSRAGRARPDELSTSECLDLVRQLAEMGTREVTLIGGEAYLRRDWLTIVSAISNAGMFCGLQTGARNLTEQRVGEAADAGLNGAGVSIDGLRELHDSLRGVSGSFDQAVAALRHLRAHGLLAGVNTQITGAVIPQLRELFELFVELGIRTWKVQLTVAMGRAADNHAILMQPYQMLEVMPLLAELYGKGEASGLLLQPGNNIGYFGPYERILRGAGDPALHWTGCYAGRNVLGIEADGTIKGCPSLPTSSYAAGNIRDRSLQELWTLAPELSFARDRDPGQLWGFCGSCYYASVCQGGCTWTTHSLLGKPGNNPYCHHRALQFAKRRLRERVVQVRPAPGQSFDHGRFEVVVEELPGMLAASGGATPPPDGVGRPTGASDHHNPVGDRAQHPSIPTLELCQGCGCYVFPGTGVCPHCGGDVRELGQTHERRLADARQAERELVDALDRLRAAVSAEGPAPDTSTGRPRSARRELTD